MAAEDGIKPSFVESRSTVLSLHYSAMSWEVVRLPVMFKDLYLSKLFSVHITGF